jgi:AbrB family looped-hinge helix DNA binding protein
MENVATITSKGQMTIPKGIRRALDLRAKDRLLFTVENDHIVIIPLRARPLTDLFGALPVDRPYPGHEAIREELRQELGQRIAKGEA